MAGFPGTMIAVSVEVSEKDEERVDCEGMTADVIKDTTEETEQSME